MSLDFSIFGNDSFQNGKPITDRSGLSRVPSTIFFEEEGVSTSPLKN